MSFLAPDNLIWAVVAVLVLVLYLWRMGGRRQKVSSYVLWQRALARRSRWSRWWQRWVSLAVALAFVALLVLALMQPFWKDAAARARTVVLVIDTSASMNATDVEPSRLAMAKTFARRIVDQLEPNEQATVISAGARVQVHCGFTKETARIHAALNGVRASEGPTRIDEAISLARRMVEMREDPPVDHPQIIVLTDSAFDTAEELADADDLNFVVVAGQPDNVGITRVAMRSKPAGNSPQREFFVEVTNVGPKPVECTLAARIEAGSDDAVSPADGFQSQLNIPARGSATTIVQLDAGDAGLATVQLDQQDHLAADNRAQLLVPELKPSRVLVVAAAESPVAVALRGLNDAQVAVVEELPDDLDHSVVTVFHGHVPETLPPGPTLVVEPDASCDLWQLNDDSVVTHHSNGAFSDSWENSPLLAGVDLWQVVVEESVGLKIDDEFESIVIFVNSIDGRTCPLYTLIPRPDAGPVLLFSARLSRAKSDLTLRPDFPILLANAVRWLGGSTRRMYEAPSTSDLVPVVPSPAPRSVTSPDGQSTPLPANQPMVGPLARGGLWKLTTTGARPDNAPPDSTEENAAPRDSVIAVNLIDAAESDIRPRLNANLEVPKQLLGGGPSQPLWMWLVVLAMLLSLIEWYLYHRRVLV